MTLSPPKQQQQHLQNVIYFNVNIKYLIKKKTVVLSFKIICFGSR